MTNEIKLLHDMGHVPVPFTVSSSAAIPKGTLLTLSDPHTVAATTALEAVIAGIAAEEKIAADTKTSLPVVMKGLCRFTASGSITAGDALISSTGGANEVETAGTGVENIIGRSHETASDTHTFIGELNPLTINQA